MAGLRTVVNHDETAAASSAGRWHGINIHGDVRATKVGDKQALLWEAIAAVWD
jgi:hypothetical protein